MTEPTMDERNKAACIAEEISPLVAKGKWGMAEGVIAQAIANERERNTDLVAACEALVKGMDAMIVDCGWRDVELAYEPRKALTDIRALLKPTHGFSPEVNADRGHYHPDYVRPAKGADWKASGGCPCRDCRGGRPDPVMTQY